MSVIPQFFCLALLVWRYYLVLLFRVFRMKRVSGRTFITMYQYLKNISVSKRWVLVSENTTHKYGMTTLMLRLRLLKLL